MKVKDGFILRKVAGESIVITVGEAARSFNGMVKLNETGAFLWEKLSKETTREQLISDMLEEFDVDKTIAERDIDAFISAMANAGFLV